MFELEELLRYLFIFVVFGSVGLGLEVIFTSILGYREKQDKHLFGFSSLWYFPLYGIIFPIGIHYIYPLIFEFHWIIRGIVYMVSIHIGEYVSMGFLRWLNNESPSEKSYKESKYHLHGLTRFDFAPVFFLLGLFFEALYKIII